MVDHQLGLIEEKRHVPKSTSPMKQERPIIGPWLHAGMVRVEHRSMEMQMASLKCKMNGSPLVTIKPISVMTCNASIVKKVVSTRCPKCRMITACKCDSSTTSDTRGFNYVLQSPFALSTPHEAKQAS
ncbi:hypothetical protein VNO77_25975 [Canavalia gladiata]|uniref:Uncharacterized protein n=1 Tax=Canavalia gladiata TaxID=3824 RepID=A0AAN9KRS5_CANGL